MNLSRRSFLAAAAVAAAAPAAAAAAAPLTTYKPQPTGPGDHVSGVLDMMIQPPIKVRLHYVNDGLDRRTLAADALGVVVGAGMAVIDFTVPATGTINRIELYREGDGYDILTVYETLHVVIGATARVSINAEGA